MAIRDYWIYQKRDVSKPWALYVVKEYDYRKPDETVLDFTLYHDDIELASHSESVVGIHDVTVKGYLEQLITFMSDNVTIASDDVRQLEESLEYILIN